jgi:hypothetical protein
MIQNPLLKQSEKAYMRFKTRRATILNKKNSRKNAHLHALNLEFHMVFSGGFSIFSFFPAVAITTVANLFPRVEEHGTTFWSENNKEK